MAEKAARFKQYEYRANSNLVLQAEGRTARAAAAASESTGEPETLRGRLNYNFGDRVAQSRPQELREKATKNREKRAKRAAQHGVNFGDIDRDRGSSVLNANIESSSYYQPKTVETRVVYEQLLNEVQRALGDQPQDILRGAADEVLAALKNTTVTRDSAKKEMLESLLGPITDEQLVLLVRIGKAIVDFSDEGGAEEDKDDEMADEMALLIDEESEDSDLDEVQDSASDDSEGEEASVTSALTAKGMDNENEEMADAWDAKDDEMSAAQVDPFWLQRELGKYYQDPLTAQTMAEKVLAVLRDHRDDRVCESSLVQLLEYDKFDFIKKLLNNRHLIAYSTMLGQAQTEEEKNEIKEQMRADPELSSVLEAIEGASQARGKGQTDTRAGRRRVGKKRQQAADGDVKMDGSAVDPSTLSVIDLDSLAFQQGSHFMSTTQCTLPEGSFRTQKKGYEEFHIPPSKKAAPKDGESKVSISALPKWSQQAFRNTDSLNLLQSRVFHCAFETHENMLVCAPTGAGKTNVAMLTILHELGLHLDQDSNIRMDEFKIVYIAPMKSLVQEMVDNFGNRLKPFGIVVNELSGDQNLTKQQIHDTQIIVTTPEKWDIVTRKSGDRTYTQLVRLIIFDEIHLLHDERGPVLESIIARTIRQVERTQDMVRLVGLSATLPNYEDVATLLRIDTNVGLHAFDISYRPVPLEQTYVGIMEKSSFKRFQLMNEVVYEKVIERAGKHQILIFVHSRKETGKTARTIRDMALANEALGKFLGEDSRSRAILQTEADGPDLKDLELKDLLPFGFAIHHAGMTKGDRTLVEDLFKDQHIQVLVSTATLAWGVNLPAHTVIIKGTQVYNPEKGRWMELSPMDVMQMIGRAGRPQYDKTGEGIVVTTHQELQYYLSLLNQQLPIESQLVTRLPDILNAEIVLGTIQNVEDAVQWLTYTYLYICMLRAPKTYGIPEEEADEDELLVKRRRNLIHTAATLLDRAHLINYDRKSGNFQVTDLGRVASHYYVSYTSMTTYNDHLKQYMADIELFRLFSLSNEFKYLAVRQEEKQEVEKLLERVPIPVKESMEDPTAKVNVLLQSYISRLKLDGFALISDMVYVTQSASRLMRALFEIVLKRGWARLAEKTLSLCKMIDRRMWSSQSPLRQFKNIPDAIIRKLERKEFSLDRLYDLNSQQIGELIHFPQQGKDMYRYIHQFPRLELSALVQPITRSMLRVELTLTPDFNWSEKYHGGAEGFWVWLEDVDGETILHHEFFILKKKYSETAHYLSFTVPLFEPLAPQYYVRVISDRWIGCEATLPISFRHMLLPERYSPPTDLLDLQPLPVTALQNKRFEKLFEYDFFNPIQTQVFPTLFQSDENALVCSPTGSGKSVMAEFVILRAVAKKAGEGESARVVFLCSHAAMCEERYADWTAKFGEKLGLKVVMLTGETAVDLKLLDVGNLIITTPINWDRLSRRWRQRRNVQNVDLFIADEIHLLGGENGHIIEAVVSRMRYIAAQVENKIRLVAFSTSLANARDVGEWIGAGPHSTFNFRPHVRPVPLEIHLQGFDQVFAEARHLAMYRPTLLAIERHAGTKPVLVFTCSRKEAFRLASEIRFTFPNAAEQNVFKHCTDEDLASFVAEISHPYLAELLQRGIGVIHPYMEKRDREIVESLYVSGAIQVLVAERTECWGMTFKAHMVAIVGTQYYDGKEHRYVDYPVTDVLEMMGKASRPKIDASGVCVIFCYAPKKQYYLKFLHEPLPIESHLDHSLGDHFNAEIVTRTIENKQDAVDYLTWTFLYRCLTQNPNYYNLQGTSHRHLSDHLSELVETTLNDLSASNCIAIEDEMDLNPVNLGMIAAYYYINCSTVELFASSLTARTKMKGLIEILSSATEFTSLPIRRKEAGLLAKIAAHLPVKIDKPDYSSTHTKTNILLQCHFSRRQLPPSLVADQKIVLENSVRLLQAMVDVISSNRWLGPALSAMELTQMITQAIWDTDSHLKQLPHVSDALAQKCKKAGVEGIFDLMDMEDKDRAKLLSSLDQEQVMDIAAMCNDYPNVDVVYKVEDGDSLTAHSDIVLSVSLEREMDEDQVGVPAVHAPFYPIPKAEGWWLVVCNVKTKELLAIKRITLQKSANVKLAFQTEEGHQNLTLYLMCDSYVGCDQEFEVEVDVGAEVSSEEEEDDEDEENGVAPMSD